LGLPASSLAAPATLDDRGLLTAFDNVRTELAATRHRLLREPDAGDPGRLAGALGDHFTRLIERELLPEMVIHDRAVALSVAYAAAALVDESLGQYFEFQGTPGSFDHEVERRLFGTGDAAITLFRQIDRHLKGGGPESGELGAVYLMVLSLGFRGPYRDTPDHPDLAFLRNGLERIALPDRDRALAGSDVLCPEAYRGLCDSSSQAPSAPALAPWLAAGGMTAIGLLLAGHWIWDRLAAELQAIIAAG
jgi:type VI secretion system protein ImpK